MPYLIIAVAGASVTTPVAAYLCWQYIVNMRNSEALLPLCVLSMMFLFMIMGIIGDGGIH